MNCWISTANVDTGLWVCIALAIPVVIALGLLHRKEKFTCFGPYNPIGLEDRLKSLSTLGLAIFFLIKMCIGGDESYIGKIWAKDASVEAAIVQRSHIVCAFLTIGMRILLSIVQIISCAKNGNWKTTKPFSEIYN